jgi:predicted HTH transcriptional regulator
MIPKALDDINAADIQSLIGSDIREGRTLDDKQVLPGETGDEKREFLADVSSFANTSGGDIVFGMREEEGVAAEILGIAGTDLDAAILRMDSIIATGIQPRVRHRIQPVRSALAGPVVIIRIERSSIGPHRVVFRGHDKFYARN